MTHAEYIRQGTQSDTAVLMIHGILGTPRHFDFLLPLVPPQWSVYNILLDGHGKCVCDFSHTSMDKWRTQVQNTVQELSRTHKRILIAAHSMGTLLAMEAAMQESNRVCALFLLASPLYMHLKPVAARNAMRWAFGRLNLHDPIQQATRDSCSIRADRCLWRYMGWIPRYLELFAYARKMRTHVSKLTMPCEVFQSQRDELVSPRAVRILQSNPSWTVHVLKNSTHFYYEEADRARVKNAFEAICARVSEQDL